MTTIITFLLVALLRNTQSRLDESVQQKLNALADLMRTGDPDARLKKDRRDLLESVGLEDRVSSS